MKNRIDEELTNVLNYLKIFPLIFMCSIPSVRNGEKVTFKPEYIIPQFLLQWLEVEKDSYQGIRYFSVKNPQILPEKYEWNHYILDLLCQNIVIPIKESMKRGYSKKLLKQFHIKNPVSYQEYLILKDNLKHRLYPCYLEHGDFETPYKDQMRIDYRTTIFGQIEDYLHTPICEECNRTLERQIFLYGNFKSKNWEILDDLATQKGFKQAPVDAEKQADYIIVEDVKQKKEYELKYIDEETPDIYTLEEFKKLHNIEL